MSVLSKRVAAPRRKRAVKNPIPWYTPRFWHGMRLGTWLKALARNRFAVSPLQMHTAASITAVAGFNSLAAGLDNVLYGRRIAATELTAPPVFILGHWRAGTTFLHELLIRDPEHTYPTTYQCFAPHHFVLTDRWFTPWTGGLLPSRRPMDNMAAGWQRPQEDEFALCNLGVPTPYLSMMFPRRGAVYPEYLDLQSLDPAARDAWQQQLLTYFRRITFHDPRRIVVKSPPHTARVRWLLELFPTAKFVHIVRNPYELYLSTINLWKSLNSVQGMQSAGEQEWLEEYVLSSLERMYAAFEQDRQLLDASQLYDVQFEDLIDDPLPKLSALYDQLALGDFSRIAEAVETHLESVKNYRRNRYELDEQVRATVRSRWAGYFERYGYEQ